MLVEEIMTVDPVTVTEETTIGDALSVMTEKGVRHLPVVRGAEVVGILSDRDFADIGASLLNGNKDFESLRAQLSQQVNSLMSGGVLTVDSDADLTEVTDLVVEEKLSALPVVESGSQRLVGIVSYVDLLRAARPLFENA